MHTILLEDRVYSIIIAYIFFPTICAEMDLYFYGNTPHLAVDSVYAQFESNRAGMEYECHLTHFSGDQRTNCKTSTANILQLCCCQVHCYIDTCTSSGTYICDCIIIMDCTLPLTIQAPMGPTLCLVSHLVIIH